MGLGYVGLPTAALLASRGHNVIGVDTNQSVVDTINSGKIHIVEPELDILVKTAVESGRLTASPVPVPADVFIICVPTPVSRETHEGDMRCVVSCVQSLIPVLQSGNLVLLESTSPPGTTEQLVGQVIEAAGFRIGQDIYVAYCPERVLPGATIRELTRNERIVGGVSDRCAEEAAAFYRTFVQGDIHQTDARTAETVKLVENTSRDYQIAFANELSLICESIDVNTWEVIRLANRHPRVRILEPGPGVGGHCIAVDPWFLIQSAPEEAKLIRAVREFNDSMPLIVANRIEEIVAKKSAQSVALLGMAYKANIDDCRESPSINIYQILKQNGRVPTLYVCEPNTSHLDGVELSTLKTCIEEADIIVILVKHSIFAEVNWVEIMREKTVLDFKGLTHGLF